MHRTSPLPPSTTMMCMYCTEKDSYLLSVIFLIREILERLD